MRREVLVTAVVRIIDDLTSSGLHTMLRAGIDAVRKRSEQQKEAASGWPSFEVFQKYSLLTANYGETEERILSILDIKELRSAALWSRLTDFPPGQLHELWWNVNFAINHLPKLLQLLQQDHVQEVKSKSAGLASNLTGKELLTVILIEEGDMLSSPARIIHVLGAVTDMYEVLARLGNESASDLSVLACDSGSDKSFDFLGIARLIAEVRQLIVDIWDRRVFYRHMHASQCIGHIAESLPVIERIQKLRESGALGPEEAEILRRKAIEGATKFLEAGAVISDLDSTAPSSPRMLMRPEPKLLAAPLTTATSQPASSVAQESAAGLNDEHMTDDEIAELERLVDKAKKAKPSRRPRKPDA